ncbi:MAG: amidohydrolase family protein [Planctomycetota bacterium]|nr:amidohydrolase family protein [Planctomycetota bacterium]
MPEASGPALQRRENNLFGIDYRADAAQFAAIPGGIIDCHTHVHGVRASRLYGEVAKLFGVVQTYTMTQLPLAAAVRDVLGDRVRFIAFPSWSDPDKSQVHRAGFLRAIEAFHRDFGARMLKIWSAPRLRELVPDGAEDVWQIDSPWRREACKLGQSLGMMFMVHVADPDTWFATKYADASKYGKKLDHYIGLERMLDDFPSPWIAAHFGGWPEDLGFLDALLTRHPNLHLDTSATRWLVRELSKHPSDAFVGFLRKHSTRILFGTDIVTTDDHLSPTKANQESPKSDQASNEAEAFDLYASRFWVIRRMLEGTGEFRSPIADPDLPMIDPTRYGPDSSPTVRGMGVPMELLRAIYRDNAVRLLDAWYGPSPKTSTANAG